MKRVEKDCSTLFNIEFNRWLYFVCYIDKLLMISVLS